MLTSFKLPSRLGALAVAVAASMFGMTVHATDITGAGSSFVYPVISKWSAAYAEKTGNHINYQSIGSGGGIAQIKAGTVDFGASDMPLKPEDLAKFGLGQFPDVIGGIVPAFNVAGVAPGTLVLWARSRRGTIRRSPRSIRAFTCRRRRSTWCIVPTVRARPSTSPTTSRR